MGNSVSVIASLYKGGRAYRRVVEATFNMTETMEALHIDLGHMLLVEQATEYAKTLCKEGLSVLVRPNWNETDYYREWRSFDGAAFEEIRFPYEAARHFDTGIILPEGLEDRAVPPKERKT